MIKKTTPDGKSILYSYDQKGNKIAETTPSGTTNYEYDQLNRLVKVIAPNGDETVYTYNAVGNRSQVTHPNNTVTEYTYDKLNRLTNLVNLKSSGGVISSHKHILGKEGNRIKVIENSGRTVKYQYDELYRLTEEEITKADGTTRTITYSYDKVGNRLSKTDDGVTINYSYNANDRLLTEGSTTYTYDDNGNTIAKSTPTGVTNYSYNHQNKLVRAEINDDAGTKVIEYAYDTQGNRVKKTVDGAVTKYLVDTNRRHAQVLEERDSRGNLKVSYVYGDDLLSQNRNGAKSYYYYDGLGSTRALTDNTGNVTDTYNYDAFGNLLERTGSTKNNYQFTEEQYDPNIGFYYLRARYMNPSIGRFVTMDTWEGNNYDPRSLHKYLYCGNDPINRIDPSGHFFGGVIGVAFNLSISNSIRAYQFEYYDMLLKNVIDAKEISDIMLDTAVRLQDVCLQLVAEGKWYEGITMNAYNTARAQEAKGYKVLSLALAKNMYDMGVGFMDMVQLELNLSALSEDFDDHEIGLGSLIDKYYGPGDPMDNIENNTEEYLKKLGGFKEVNSQMKEILNELFDSEYKAARKGKDKILEFMKKLL